MIASNSKGKKKWQGKDQNLNNDLKDITNPILALSKQMTQSLMTTRCEEQKQTFVTPP